MCRAPRLEPATLEVLANLVIAGEQGGSVTGLSPAKAGDALGDLEQNYTGAGKVWPYNWGLFVLHAIAICKPEPGGADDCADLHRKYGMAFEDPAERAPAKRGRPTQHSGHFGRAAPGGPRTAWTKLDRVARQIDILINRVATLEEQLARLTEPR